MRVDNAFDARIKHRVSFTGPGNAFMFYFHYSKELPNLTRPKGSRRRPGTKGIVDNFFSPITDA